MSRSRRLHEDIPCRAADGRLGAFGALTLAHPHLVTAREALMSALRSCAGNTIIFVVGPTGVGKTTLRVKIEHDLTTNLKEQRSASKHQRRIQGVSVGGNISGDSSMRCGSP